MLKRGNIRHVAIIAPSGPADEATVRHGAELLELKGIKVTIMPHVFSQCAPLKYLSASVSDRLDDLHAALNDNSVDMLLCARGGFGAVHLLDHIDYDLMRQRDLPLIGYSDITALHFAMLAKNAGRPWVAPMGIKLERLFNDPIAQQLMYPLFEKDECEIATLELIRPSSNFSALPVAANLTVAAAQCGSDYMPDFCGKILILEDIGEPLYKLDRCLSQLKSNRVFEQAAGVIFGQFTDCAEWKEIDKLIAFHLNSFPPFVAKNFPFGHDWPIVPLDLTRKLELREDKIIMSASPHPLHR